MPNQIPMYLKDLLFVKWKDKEKVLTFMKAQSEFDMNRPSVNTYPHMSKVYDLDFSDDPNNKEIINKLLGQREEYNNVDIIYMYDGNDNNIEHEIFKNNKHVYKLMTAEHVIFTQKKDYMNQFNPCNF